ncbi:MAG: hypothetical protein ACSLFM_02675 [Tepidiformaceae bacterium]
MNPFIHQFSPNRRLLAIVVLLGLTVIAALSVWGGTARAADQVCSYHPQLPLTVHIDEGVDATIVRSAIAEWNAFWPGTFVETTGSGVVTVSLHDASNRTYASLPCMGSDTTTIFAGTDVDLNYWMTHELGHALGFADQLVCDDTTAYRGVMSYCTPREDWFGRQDRWLMMRHFGYRVIAAGAAR